MPRKMSSTSKYSGKSSKGKKKISKSKKTKFSKYNLYKYSGAKSQAKQIYDLNKKMKYMYKQFKPDINTISIPLTPSASLNFTSTSVAPVAQGMVEIMSLTQLSTISSSADYINIRNITYWFNYRYNGLSGTSQPMYLRLVFIRLRTAGSFPTIANVLNTMSDSYAKVKGPLRAGLYDSGYKVIGDYKYKMTNENPSLDLKFKFYGRKYDKAIGTSNQPEGSIMAYIYIYNPNYSNPVNNAECTMFEKIAYDQMDGTSSS